MESLYRLHNVLIANSAFDFRRNFIDSVHWNERLTGILGARGVGKTTCMLQYITENFKPGFREALYVTYDNPSIPYNSLFDLADDFYKKGGKHLFIDEIHKYPHWAIELKNIYDQFPKLKITFSGSSILKLLTGGVDLSRRAVLHHLNGLSYREFLMIKTKTELPVFTLKDILKKHVEIAQLLCKKIKPIQHFDDYLRFGYYPFFLQGEQSYLLKLQSVISYVVENEMQLFTKSDVLTHSKMKKLLRIMAGSVPFQPNILKLAEAVELNRNTLIEYIGNLAQADIIISVNKTGSFYGKLSKPGKIMLKHPNLYHCLSNGDVELGTLRETFFVNQVINKHNIELPEKADFLVDEKFTFEIGGKTKDKKQITEIKDSFVVADDIETGYENKIPLWLFGFLY